MRPTIVVGLGGANGYHALAWAAEHAAATGGSLVLCHACGCDSPLAAPRPGPPTLSLLEIAEPTLARAVSRAQMRLGGHRVSVRAEPVGAATLLLDAAGDAGLLVLGPPGRTDAVGRIGTVHRVAARAAAPVVVARRGGGRTHGPFAGHVLVGVDGSPLSRVALEFGFAEAALHGRPLAAVHVSPRRRDDPDLLAREVEPWEHKFPDVPVTRAVFAGRPLDGLIRAAAGAALLVVGQRHRRLAARALLGTVADGAVAAADAPVALVKEAHR